MVGDVCLCWIRASVVAGQLGWVGNSVHHTNGCGPQIPCRHGDILSPAPAAVDELIRALLQCVLNEYAPSKM